MALIRDLFSSLVGSNLDLSNAEKMHYLRSSLSGEAAQIIANLTISDESFATAWDLLIGRYDNTRLHISAYLEQLLSPPAMTAHSAKELNALLTTVSDALNALKAIGSPTTHWDQVVIHTVSQRLSSKLREAWEVKVGSSTDYPSFTDLKDFLVGRARAMESIEINAHSRAPSSHNPSSVQSSGSGRSSQPRSHGSARVNNVTTQSGSAQGTAQVAARTYKVTYPCSMCEADHYLASCQAFKRVSFEGRSEVVNRRYLCFNCLGRHGIRDCRSRTKCQICGLSHHSLLHPTSSGSQQSSRPVHRGQQQQSSRPAHPMQQQQSSRPAQTAAPAPVVSEASTSPE